MAFPRIIRWRERCFGAGVGLEVLGIQTGQENVKDLAYQDNPQRLNGRVSRVIYVGNFVGIYPETSVSGRLIDLKVRKPAVISKPMN
jgi:hypothetical protein